MTTITKVITTMPTAPTRSQTPDVFITNADTTLGAINTFVSDVNTWSGQTNQVAAEVNNYASNASTSANTASTKAAEASASAQSANSAAGAVKWVSGTTYAEGDVRWSPTSYLSYRRKVAGDGTTDPVSDTTNWAQIQTDYNNAINPTAIAQSINMTAAASGSNGIAIADNADINAGIGDITIHLEGGLPNWGTIDGAALVDKTGGSASGYQLGIGNTTQGVFRLKLNATAYNFSTIVHGNVLTANTAHKVTVVVSQSTLLASLYVEGVFAESKALSSAVDISSVYDLQILGFGATRTVGRAKSAYIFNRALTAAEVLDLCRNGVAFADKWGSQTEQTSGTLTVGKRYRINNWITNDDFVNVGGTNGDGSEFIAT